MVARALNVSQVQGQFHVLLPSPPLCVACIAARAASSVPDAPVPNGSKYSSPDTLYTDNKLPAGSAGDERKAFQYFVLGGARFLYASAARLAVINVVATLSASADVLALSSVEVDLSSINMGQTVTVKWRGKPVFIKHRTAEQIADEAKTNIAELRHAQTDLERVKDPQWYVTPLTIPACPMRVSDSLMLS